LCQTAACLGIEITPQSMDDRFGPKSSELRLKVLASGVEKMITSDSVGIPLLQRFNGVYFQDSSTIMLPDELKEVWEGCGRSSPQNTSASVKPQVQPTMAYLDRSVGEITGYDYSALEISYKLINN